MFSKEATEPSGEGLSLRLSDMNEAYVLMRGIEALKGHDATDGRGMFTTHPTLNRLQDELLTHLRGSEVHHISPFYAPLTESQAKQRAKAALDFADDPKIDLFEVVSSACHPHPLTDGQRAHLVEWVQDVKIRLEEADKAEDDALYSAILPEEIRAAVQHELRNNNLKNPGDWP